MKQRFVCIHGHFYQPPRENPWLEAVELQDSAYPFHDWNSRIAAECYAPNGVSRILDHDGRIAEIVNNYAKISFNFGPTLAAWLEAHRPDVYDAIRAADEMSARHFGGHGSAMAQAYNHAILPLCNPRDQRTQVLWGLRDFRHRFGRPAEGMWLPETAVDLPTLEALAEAGVKFTVLDHGQAHRVRPAGSDRWQTVTGGRIDPTRAYRQRLPSGRAITLLFYDGPISRAVAFERLLEDGERFAARLLGAFDDSRDHAQLVHIATDGESYGHHHRRGEMALSAALRHVETSGHATLTNYGQFIERFPPTWEVEIAERTAWSCVHGLGRWTRDCGCSASHDSGWSQGWREPLRAALDWLRDTVAPVWEEQASALLRDPWGARDRYIEVVLDRSPGNVERFLLEAAASPLADDQVVRALELLELQRNAMLMYTSCGWFFDEISGPETVQVVAYAARVAQLARDALALDLEPELLERLAEAKSNIPEIRDGRTTYERFVRPAALDLERVCAHFALSALFESASGGTATLHCYDIEDDGRQLVEAGAARLVAGTARVRSRLTRAEGLFEYAALRFGDGDFTGGVRPAGTHQDGHLAAARDAFARADLTSVIRHIGGAFPQGDVTLRSLFRDEQRRVIQLVIDRAERDAEASYRQLYERRAPFLRLLTDVGVPVPRWLGAAAEISLNAQLQHLVREPEPDAERIRALLDRAAELRVPIDSEGAAYELRQTLEGAAEQLRTDPTDLDALLRFGALVRLAVQLPFEVSLWGAQNVYWELLQDQEQRTAAAAGGDTGARAWLDAFGELAGPLGVAPRQPA